jgi:DNA-directed RNA polymerase subunit RPC12/RpoP
VTTFQIDHNCPQCGAPVNLEETDRLFVCPFCRVKSFLLTRDYFRYVLPAKTKTDHELVYLPYWRFKGILLFSLTAGTDHKFIDVSHCAAELAGMPMSLGLRAQAMKLRFVSPDLGGRFIPPVRSSAETFALFQRRFSQSLRKPILYWAHLGESMGLLYSPFCVKDKLYDAVLDTPVGRIPSSLTDGNFKYEKPDWKVGFVAALCPDCGWDLEGDRDALVLHCRNCQSSWYPSSERLTRVGTDVMEGSEPDAFFIPFWQITCELSGIDLRNLADLARLANLPKAVGRSLQAHEFRFWAPAFKVRPQAYLRLAESLTLNQGQNGLAPALPPGRHHPVTLPVEEACESLKVVLAGFMKPRKLVAEMLPFITIHPTHFRLAYLPFQENQHDYIQSRIQIAVNKNLLNLSRNL